MGPDIPRVALTGDPPVSLGYPSGIPRVALGWPSGGTRVPPYNARRATRRTHDADPARPFTSLCTHPNFPLEWRRAPRRQPPSVSSCLSPSTVCSSTATLFSLSLPQQENPPLHSTATATKALLPLSPRSLRFLFTVFILSSFSSVTPTHAPRAPVSCGSTFGLGRASKASRRREGGGGAQRATRRATTHSKFAVARASLSAFFHHLFSRGCPLVTKIKRRKTAKKRGMGGD